MKSTHYLHGGDLDAVSRTYHIERKEIWDFSGNINPFGISPKTREALKENIDLISTYPDRNYLSLREAAAKYSQTLPEHIIVGNGSTELIAMAINSLKPKKALVIGPTYSEYEREIVLLGGTCDYYPLKEAESFILSPEDLISTLTSGYTMLILCNPNNPTGTGVTADHLRQILEAAKRLGVFTMVDETYIEFCDDPALYTAVPLTKEFDNLMIIRGISKFFSAPGLRFGYSICQNEVIKASVTKLQNPWSINSLAAFSAEIMFTDKDYIQKTHRLISAERNRIYAELSQLKSLHVFKPIANFVLIKLLKDSISSFDLTHELIKDRILIRDASSFPFLSDRYIRFCFLKPEQNDILLLKLKNLITQNGAPFNSLDKGK